VRQHLSLAGTELNCAGGPTPWGSWLSCEECFEGPGTGFSRGRLVTRDRKHGYVFEVPASETGLAEPVPITAMGRFEHEACAVHEPSGIVYMTEDRHYSLFYRYIPTVPGRLREGGRLQALAVAGRPALQLHNWSGDPVIGTGESLPTHWIDLDDVDTDENDLRLRGAAAGAATFARGEGLCAAGHAFAFTCTIGGRLRLGQVFLYQPSPMEGRAGEEQRPGQLTLVAEAGEGSLLRNADNLTMSPWGDPIAGSSASGPTARNTGSPTTPTRTPNSPVCASQRTAGHCSSTSSIRVRRWPSTAPGPANPQRGARAPRRPAVSCPRRTREMRRRPSRYRKSCPRRRTCR
jgi:secreted PhoX family phosphatase